MDDHRPQADDDWPQCPRCNTRYGPGAQYCQRDGARLVVASVDAPDRYLGRVLLDQFRLDEVLGTGGMGTVYRAHQSSLDRDVAIKILHSELADHPDAVRRFQREARVATALDHPNVVQVLLLGQLSDGSPYLVMEHVPGRSLGRLLRQEGALPLRRALHIATQVADAVGEAHAHGIVHRDVKPENVMVVHRGDDVDFVKVLDFGIARLLWDEQTVATQSGVIFGTARYISPEGASGEPTDARSDVYSIGVLAYQLIAGVTPFDGSTPVTLLLQHAKDPVPDIREQVRCPDGVADVLMKALRKRPGERFDDGKALAQALREAAAASGVRVSEPAATASSDGTSSPGTGGAAAVSSPAAEERGEGTWPAGTRRQSRLGPGATLLLAFVLGAGAVTAGGVLVGWLLRDGPAAVEDPVHEAGRGAVTSGGSEAAGVSPTPPKEGTEEARAEVSREPAEDEAPERARREAQEETRARQDAHEAQRRPRERSGAPPPVTTFRSGRGDPEWEAPTLAPAVERRSEADGGTAEAQEDGPAEAPPSDPAEPEHGGDETEVAGSDGSDPAPEGQEAPEAPPPPWTGTVL